MIFWYKLLTYLFYPFANIYLFFRKINNKEHPVRYKEKLAHITKQKEDGYLIWFHVASVGEAMSILPLIDRCINEKGINKILISSITLSSGKILEKKFKDEKKIIHQYLPLDISHLTKKFLEHWRPNLCVFIDSEIWPNLILNINKKKIPLFLVNARITKKSFKRWKLVKGFAKKIFQKFDLCIVSNKESEYFLKDLGAKNIKNYGNLKFSNIKNDLNKTLDIEFLNKVKNRKIWSAASTHPTEELICAKSHLKVKENYSNILTIIIPRHIDRVEKIKKELSKLSLKIVLSSELNKVNETTDIILVNSYGETLKFYNISKYVFLGKSLIESLKEDSGQNPIEPARLGCKIFHGPYISNFLETYQYLKELEVTKIVNNSNELSLSLVEEFKDEKPKNQEIEKKIENYGQNILNSVILELKKYIGY
jgi:3-deoxy-D-manno-octulosonic-acid transferase